jgi:tetratricopeptide (TPR) repeat protein
MEPATAAGSATEFRNFTANKLRKNEWIYSLKTFEHKQTPGIKYAMASLGFALNNLYPAPPDTSMPMNIMEAFFVRDDASITLSALLGRLTKEDEEWFYAVLDSVKFTDASNPSSSFDYYARGKSLIRQQQRKEAAAFLDTALRLEQEQRQLDIEHWRTLIGHLVNLHSAEGDTARVKELLDYGVTNDPASPIFHLGLARYYASLGEVDASIASLEKAYLHRKNDARSAAWRDPMSDPSFEPFKKNEKFRKAVKAMKK